MIQPLSVPQIAASTCIKHIAIVGGGPTGIACAKYLSAERAFETIDVFEQRNNVGGIWNLSNNQCSRNITIPQTNPDYGGGRNNSKASDRRERCLDFESPLYDYLETNIPKTLMAYSDLPFKTDLPLFPKHEDVLKYFEAYAEPVKHLIHLRTKVIQVQPESNADQTVNALGQKWNITTKDLKTNVVQTKVYDAVIIANGHYTVPHVPNINGLKEWHLRYPNTVIHSKAYRRPEDFDEKKVLVIGNSASGLDIATQIAPYAQTPVYLVSRSVSQLAPSGCAPSWRKDVGEIEEFLPNTGNRTVRFKSGEILEGFDAVIFATGYFYSFPFIREQPSSSTSTSYSVSPSNSAISLGSKASIEQFDADGQKLSNDNSAASPSSLELLTTTGLRTHEVYKHFLHINHPTLAFPVLNIKVIPFPLAENQAAVIARIWSGRLDLPSQDLMKQWQVEEEQRLFKAKRLRPAPNTESTDDDISHSKTVDQTSLKYEGGFHTLVYPEDAYQINSLYKWAETASQKDGLENDGFGKLGTQWDERQVWLRGQFADIKAAYAKYGDKRTEITNLEMLGKEWEHGFDDWSSRISDEEKRSLFVRSGVKGW